MDTPGWFRLTGVRSIKISADQGVRKAIPQIAGWLFNLFPVSPRPMHLSATNDGYIINEEGLAWIIMLTLQYLMGNIFISLYVEEATLPFSVFHWPWRAFPGTRSDRWILF
jgi:hypothetical protein